MLFSRFRNSGGGAEDFSGMLGYRDFKTGVRQKEVHYLLCTFCCCYLVAQPRSIKGAVRVKSNRRLRKGVSQKVLDLLIAPSAYSLLPTKGQSRSKGQS